MIALLDAEQIKIRSLDVSGELVYEKALIFRRRRASQILVEAEEVVKEVEDIKDKVAEANLELRRK